MTYDFPSTWPVRCPRCSHAGLVELPYGAAPGRTGIDACPLGHSFLFRYDGVTVVALDLVIEAERPDALVQPRLPIGPGLTTHH